MKWLARNFFVGVTSRTIKYPATAGAVQDCMVFGNNLVCLCHNEYEIGLNEPLFKLFYCKLWWNFVDYSNSVKVIFKILSRTI